MFKRAAIIDVVHVPFKGSAPALADTVGGQISMMFDTIVALWYAKISPTCFRGDGRLQTFIDSGKMLV
jgi:tripartite-type tricarboxylate transporter receptor subunit TctC